MPELAATVAPRIDKDAYDGNASDERIYLDLRASTGYTTEIEKLERNLSKINLSIQLKAPATKKISEYLYALSRQGLTLHHKTYGIVQEDDDFLE